MSSVRIRSLAPICLPRHLSPPESGLTITQPDEPSPPALLLPATTAPPEPPLPIVTLVPLGPAVALPLKPPGPLPLLATTRQGLPSTMTVLPTGAEPTEALADPPPAPTLTDVLLSAAASP